jgi:hypothetical protein
MPVVARGTVPKRASEGTPAGSSRWNCTGFVVRTARVAGDEKSNLLATIALALNSPSLRSLRSVHSIRGATLLAIH